MEYDLELCLTFPSLPDPKSVLEKENTVFSTTWSLLPMYHSGFLQTQIRNGQLTGKEAQCLGLWRNREKAKHFLIDLIL